MKRRPLVVGAAAPGLLGARATPAETRPITIGVTTGVHAEIADVVRQAAVARGLALRVDVRANDRAINADLARGALDAASFQDAIAFAAEVAHRRGEALVDVAATVTRPVAIYSRRLVALKQLADGATVGIDADPAAAARALILLQNHGLLTLRDGAGLRATRHDVVATQRGLRLVALPGERLAGALDRLTCAVIGSEQAARAGLRPARDSIGIEDARTPYADILAVRRADSGLPWVAALVAAYHAEPVKRFILDRFQDSVRRPW